MTNWRDATMTTPRIGPLGWILALVRGLAFGAVTYSGLMVLLLLRLIERPLFGLHRPWTPYITQAVCKAALRIMGMRMQVTGTPMPQRGAVVANHSSWLDIFALNAAQRVYFVSKSEVAAWPLIGWLARATGTVFIARKGSEAKRQQEQFEARLRAGHQLLFFPEGTSTDALRVLPFKSTLFAAFYSHGLDQILHIQPVTVAYHAPRSQDARYYGWWGDMTFSSHFLQTLATLRQGSIEVIFHPPVPVDAFASRKDLAAYCETVIRTAHPLATAQ